MEGTLSLLLLTTMKTLSSNLKRQTNVTKPVSKKQSAYEMAIAICQDIKELKDSK